MTPTEPLPTEGPPVAPAAGAGVGPARLAIWTGTVAACLCAFGLLSGSRIGGVGPALFWLGLIAGGGAFAIGTLLRRLSTDQQTTLEPLFAGVSVALPVGALALVALEVIASVKFPLPETLWVNPVELQGMQRPHPRLGWAPTKNHVATVSFAERSIEMKLNARGFRDIEQELDATRPRVVILGDSFPLGWGGDYASSVTPRLREVLPEAQIFNASWVGYTLDQVALSYSSFAKPLAPDVVLVMLMVRPGVDDSLPLYRGMRKSWFVLHDGKLETRGLPIEFATTVESNKQLYRTWEADRITGPRAAFRFIRHEFPSRYLAIGRRLIPRFDWTHINRHGLPGLSALQAAILHDLERQIEADGAKMVLVIAPGVEIYEGCEDPGAAMAIHAASYRAIGIDPLDITPYLTDDWRSFHNQESHPNAKAIDRIRKDLADRVRAALGE